MVPHQPDHEKDAMSLAEPEIGVSLPKAVPMCGNSPLNEPHKATVTASLSEADTSEQEISEPEGLRLQMAMDRLSKIMQTLSNLEKKASDTDDTIVSNMK